jgi:starch phosphorylase
MSVYRYRPREFYEKNAELKQALDQIRDGFFSPENPELFHDVVDSLLRDNGDQYVHEQANKAKQRLSIASFRYMLLADYESYVKCQERVTELFKVRFRLPRVLSDR